MIKVGRRVGSSEEVMIVSKLTTDVYRGSRVYHFVANVPLAVSRLDAAELLEQNEFSETCDSAPVRIKSGVAGRSMMVVVPACSAPLVSVIMPCYNYEKYVKDAIQSVLSQTFKDFELIVVDDCSTDHSLDVIIEESAKDNRIGVVRQLQNMGVHIARNTGINAARGDLVTVLDADDMFVPNRLERQVVQFLEDKDLDFLWGDAETVDRTQHPMMKSGEPDTDLLIRQCYIPACSVMFKAKVLYREGLYRPLKAAEDWDLYVRLLARGVKAKYLPGVTYRYRVHGDNKTKRDSAELNSKDYMDVIRNNATIIRQSTEYNTPTNLLIVCADASLGGSNIATLSLIKHLNREMFTPHVYIMSDHNGRYFYEELEKMSIECIIQLEDYSHVPVTGNNMDVNRIKTYMKEHSIGLLHNIVVVAARVAARGLGIPVVQMRHQIDYSMIIEPKESYVSICEDGLQGGVPNSYIVYNGIDTVKFARDHKIGQEIREYCQIPKEDKVVLWAGRMDDIKGPGYLVDVVEGLDDDISVLFVPIHRNKEYDYVVETLTNSSTKVHVMDEWGHGDMRKLYSAADIVLNTSKSEGNGLTLMEGMSCGCVPVAFSVGGIPEIVISNYNGMLSVPYDTRQIAKSINDLYPDQIQCMSNNARLSVVRRFEMMQTITRFEDIYKETLVRCSQ